MTRLTEVEGIGEAYAGKLAESGIATQESLLEACCEAAGRRCRPTAAQATSPNTSRR